MPLSIGKQKINLYHLHFIWRYYIFPIIGKAFFPHVLRFFSYHSTSTAKHRYSVDKQTLYVIERLLFWPRFFFFRQTIFKQFFVNHSLGLQKKFWLLRNCVPNYSGVSHPPKSGRHRRRIAPEFVHFLQESEHKYRGVVDGWQPPMLQQLAGSARSWNAVERAKIERRYLPLQYSILFWLNLLGLNMAIWEVILTLSTTVSNGKKKVFAVWLLHTLSWISI